MAYFIYLASESGLGHLTSTAAGDAVRLSVTFCSVSRSCYCTLSHSSRSSADGESNRGGIDRGFPVCVLIAFNQHQIPKARFNDSVSDLMESLLTP